QGIYNTANIVVNGNANITIQDGAFQNNGTFAADMSTVVLSGSAATTVSAIGGSSTTTFNNLTINKTSNGTQLAGNIAVNGNLTMQSGNLDMNLYNIDLGSGSGTIVNENNNARITGTAGGNIIKTVSLNAPSSVNPGNIGIEISSSANLGNTVIKRGHVQQTANGGFSIYRYFDITAVNNSSLNASLKMYYFDGELAGINKTDLQFYRSEDIGTTWSLAGKDNSDETNDWVIKNNIDRLSRWTLSANLTALPVQLISFTATLINRQTHLKWTTAQEINSNHFDVERSPDAVSFNRLLSVRANGNTNSPSNYYATDTDPLTDNYYRLKEIDNDGRYSYSSVVHIILDNNTSYLAYPNPAKNIFFLGIYALESKSSKIALIDASGRLLQEKSVQLRQGNNLLQWDISSLAKGTYFLKSTDSSVPVIKMMKL
ncbi:MAG: T9SS type A sorting domain-containing protein, partial [Bacteroidetes bacterium]|nr:T9SS type A sorting domain-containing protein [Bacteroidota bacterium]